MITHRKRTSHVFGMLSGILYSMAEGGMITDDDAEAYVQSIFAQSVRSMHVTSEDEHLFGVSFNVSNGQLLGFRVPKPTYAGIAGMAKEVFDETSKAIKQDEQWQQISEAANLIVDSDLSQLEPVLKVADAESTPDNRAVAVAVLTEMLRRIQTMEDGEITGLVAMFVLISISMGDDEGLRARLNEVANGARGVIVLAYNNYGYGVNILTDPGILEKEMQMRGHPDGGDELADGFTDNFWALIGELEGRELRKTANDADWDSLFPA